MGLRFRTEKLKEMKAKRLVILISCLFQVVFSSWGQEIDSVQYLPPWQEGYFDIHHIATGKGESQFLVFPDGTTMLIDAGDMTGVSGGWMKSRPLPDSTGTPAQKIAAYINHFSPTPGRIDYALISHFHPDHMGSRIALREGPHGYKICGIMELGEYEKIGKLVDRGYPSYDFPSVEIVEKMNAEVMPHYKQFVDYQISHNGMKAEKILVGSHKQFAPKKKMYDFDVWTVAGGLMVTTGKGLKTVPMNTEDPIEKKFDENMFSVAQVFRFGDFKYYSGGDLPGAVNTKPEARNRDYESKIVEYVAPCNVMKANHHGYDDTGNPNFLWQMCPDFIIVQSLGGGHPKSSFVDRVSDKLYRGKRMIYTTSDSGREQLGEERFRKIQDWGHIVIRVFENGSKYQIFVLDATASDYRIKSHTEVWPSKRKIARN